MEIKVAFLFVVSCATVLAAPQQLDSTFLANLQTFAAQNNINVQDLYSSLQRLPQNIQNTVPSLNGNQLPGNIQHFYPNYQQPWNTNSLGVPQTAINNYPWNSVSQISPQPAPAPQLVEGIVGGLTGTLSTVGAGGLLPGVGNLLGGLTKTLSTVLSGTPTLQVQQVGRYSHIVPIVGQQY